MVSLDEKHLIGIWYADISTNGNLLISASRTEQDGRILMNTRFRIIVDDKIWDSEDIKKFHNAVIVGTEEQAIESVRRVMEEGNRLYNGGKEIIYEFIVSDYKSFDEFIDALTSSPGIHSQKLSKEEAHKQFGQNMSEKTKH